MSSPPTRRRARLFGLVASLVTALWGGSGGLGGLAFAQTTPNGGSAGSASGALDRFDPAPAGDTFFSVPSADVAGRLRLSAAATFSYAHQPLVVHYTSGGTALDWVSDQALLHLQASVAVWRRLVIDVDVPVLLQEGGSSGTVDGMTFGAPSGSHVGDVRIEARGAVLHQHGYWPAAGLTFSVWAPTGNAASFAGAGVYRYQPGIVIGAEYAHLVWGAAAGTRFQPAVASGVVASAVVGSQITGSAGVAARFYGLTVGPEAFFGINLGDHRDSIFSQTTGHNAEVLLAARYRLGPVVLGLAGGPGVGRGPGTPAYRLLASASGSFDVLPAGVPGDDEDQNGGAATPPVAPPLPPAAPEPPLDTDGDGVPDAEDACPTVVGDATPGAYRRGCPADRDRDGIPDTEDACPDVPGVPSNDPAKNGCPGDSDGDGIPDDKDACPHDKGPANADPKLNGCPTAVRVEGSQIVILQQVNFDTGRATITRDSFTVLEQVAAVLQDHPEIARLAVDGHTDNRGGDAQNKNLSERRAVAVVLWLTEHGIDARRLEARGFGQRRPIAANLTTQGRAQNRRVEFLIRRRTDQGKAGWLEGPIVEDARPSKPPEAAKPPEVAPAAPPPADPPAPHARP